MDASARLARVDWTGNATGSRAATLLPPAPVLPGLRTKVVRPRLPSDHVLRPRLIALLDQGIERRLTLVSAPGGFGKTTLLSAWDPPGYLVAWVSLDDADGDLQTFAREMVGAIQLLAPDALVATRSLLDLKDLPEPAAVATRFADELAELPDRFVIVLDDYHTIRDRQIHAFLTRFVARTASNVHLVISTREDPPLPIAKLRARVELAEVRLEHLTFTTEESHTFFGNTLPPAVSAADGERLAERTEGWAAGMRLASLSMSDAHLSTGFAIDVEGRGFQHARDFIIDDILAAQPIDLQELLLRSSIVERFCASLLDALVEQPDGIERGAEWLEVLRRANLFVTVLDADSTWYRFHHLFRDALLRCLRAQNGVEYVTSLHRRASDWFAEHELIEDAIRHALAAGDTTHAVLLIEENIHPLLDREGDLGRIEDWVRLLPADVADHSPAVLLARAWLAWFRNRPGDLPGLLRGAEALLDHDSSRDESSLEALRGTVDTLWSYCWSNQSDAQRMLAGTESALRRVPTRWRSARGYAEYMHASALGMVGRDQDARAFLEACRASATQADGVRISAGLRGESRLHYLNLRNRELTRSASAFLEVARMGNLVRTATGGHLYAGLASYVSNELLEARDHFQAVQAARGHAGIATTLDSVLGLALVWQALGDEDRASVALVEMTVLLTDVGSHGSLRLLRSCQARLALARGDLDEAGRQLRTIRDEEPTTFPSFLEVSEITRARWLLLQGTASARDEVAAIVDGLHAQASRRGHALGFLRANLLQALLLQARGATDSAISVLQDVVALARPGNILRHFVDFGPPLQHLLIDLDRRTAPADPYLAQILAAFPAMTGPLVAAAPSRRETEMSAVDALSWRELDVLALLDARMSNKEIARALNISSETVKRHTGNIYQKLQVGSRREAVARAHSLGLLQIARKETMP